MTNAVTLLYARLADRSLLCMHKSVNPSLAMTISSVSSHKFNGRFHTKGIDTVVNNHIHLFK